MVSISDMRDKAFEEGQGEMLHGLLRVSFGKGKLRRSPPRYIRVASKESKDLNIIPNPIVILYVEILGIRKHKRLT